MFVNKIFDYFAAGRPILCDFSCRYNPIVQSKAGQAVESGDIRDIAKAIEKFSVMDKKQYNQYCKNALRAAKEYDFSVLTNSMIKILHEISIEKKERI